MLYKKCLHFHFGLSGCQFSEVCSAGFYSLYIQTNIDDNNKKLKMALWFISWGVLAVELFYVTSLIVVETTLTHLLVFILAVKSTLLFTLLTGDGRSVLPLWVGTALALTTDEGCDYVTILARRRLSIRLHADFTLFTNRTCTEFARKINLLYVVQTV